MIFRLYCKVIEFATADVKKIDDQEINRPNRNRSSPWGDHSRISQRRHRLFQTEDSARLHEYTNVRQPQSSVNVSEIFLCPKVSFDIDSMPTRN